MIPGGVSRRLPANIQCRRVDEQSSKSIRFMGYLGLWRQRMGLRFGQLQDTLRTKTAFPPTVYAFIRDGRRRVRPFLITMEPFDTGVIEAPAGLGRIVVALQARICTCHILNLPSSHALITIEVAGKQVADYIPHYHTLTCCQGAYQCNMRPIAFEIPKYQSRAQTDGQPRLPIVHEVTPTPPEISLAVDNCHPQTRTGQFAAAIGKQKAAQGRKQSRRQGMYVEGTVLWRCKTQLAILWYTHIQESYVKACVGIHVIFLLGLLSIFSVGLSSRVSYYFFTVHLVPMISASIIWVHPKNSNIANGRPVKVLLQRCRMKMPRSPPFHIAAPSERCG